MSAPMSLRPTEYVLRRDRSVRHRRLRADEHGHLTLTDQRLVFSRAVRGSGASTMVHEVLVEVELADIVRIKVSPRGRGLALVVHTAHDTLSCSVPDERWWLAVQRASWLAERVELVAA